MVHVQQTNNMTGDDVGLRARPRPIWSVDRAATTSGRVSVATAKPNASRSQSVVGFHVHPMLAAVFQISNFALDPPALQSSKQIKLCLALNFIAFWFLA
jgi:hypothetical protein